MLWSSRSPAGSYFLPGLMVLKDVNKSAKGDVGSKNSPTWGPKKKVKMSFSKPSIASNRFRGKVLCRSNWLGKTFGSFESVSLSGRCIFTMFYHQLQTSSSVESPTIPLVPSARERNIETRSKRTVRMHSGPNANPFQVVPQRCAKESGDRSRCSQFSCEERC